MFGGTFAPAGWAFCDGQTDADLRERRAVHPDRHHLRRRRPGDLRPARPAEPRADPCRARARIGNNYQLGETGRRREVTLTTQQIPIHTHALPASSTAAHRDTAPGNRSSAQSAPSSGLHRGRDRPRNLARHRLTPVGGSQPHENMQPYLVHQLHHLAVRRSSRATRVRSATMSDPFVAEIRIFAVQLRARPAGRSATGSCCRSRQNTALFSLLGTFYGGDGKSTFALPDLQGNVPMHPGQGPGLCGVLPRARRAARSPSRCSRPRSRSTRTADARHRHRGRQHAEPQPSC